MLVVDGLTKFQGRQRILDQLTMSFETGCINVVTGHSGCGKSTLFHCIGGLETFEEGQILWQGKVIRKAREKNPSRLTQIGYVLQGFSLFSHLTVLENLTLAPKLVYRESAQRVETRALGLLDKMQLLEKRNVYPNQLSGGQQQRVAIARAMMMHPEVLLLDEPTTALDPQLVHALEDMIKSLAKEGLTLLVSTHHLEFAKRIADHTYFIHQGTLLADSPGAALLINPPDPVIHQFVHEEAVVGDGR